MLPYHGQPALQKPIIRGPHLDVLFDQIVFEPLLGEGGRGGGVGGSGSPLSQL